MPSTLLQCQLHGVCAGVDAVIVVCHHWVNKGVKSWLAIGVVGITVSVIYELPHTSCLSALGEENEENEMGVKQTQQLPILVSSSLAK